MSRVERTADHNDAEREVAARHQPGVAAYGTTPHHDVAAVRGLLDKLGWAP